MLTKSCFLYLAPANIEDRDWIVPSDEPTSKYILNNDQSNDKTEEHYDPTQDRQQYIAEVLHIIRPLCHCKQHFFLLYYMQPNLFN